MKVSANRNPYRDFLTFNIQRHSRYLEQRPQICFLNEVFQVKKNETSSRRFIFHKLIDHHHHHHLNDLIIIIIIIMKEFIVRLLQCGHEHRSNQNQIKSLFAQMKEEARKLTITVTMRH